MNKAMRLFHSWVFTVCITVFSIGLTHAEEGKILSGEELKEMLSKEIYLAGWNNRGERVMDLYSPDGSYSGFEFRSSQKQLQLTGTWKIEKDQVCRTFQSRDVTTDNPPSTPYTFCLM